ncbi:acyl-CoA dehydrogenase family protein [Streptomyces sp. NPDC006879]|uniref:acyl-CoA dehydrogenase family protein n=1 Tax=Streptomyces sp. NPDC006879 TaxID=3364767 RepID=UPI0036B5AEE0
MDFTPTEEQSEAAALASRILADLATPERLAATGTGCDNELWKALCSAGLPAAAEESGLVGLVLLLEEQGRTTAQVPLAASCVYGLWALGEHGSADQRARLLPALRTGTAVATGAFPARGEIRATRAPDGGLCGVLPLVPWLRGATHVLVPDADRRLWLVATGAPGVQVRAVQTTAPWSAGRLRLDGARAEPVGGPGSSAYEQVLQAARTAFAGLAAGVCAGSLARAVSHTATREQFGKPLAANQAVRLRAADAHMDTEAIRVTTYEAAWRIDAGLDARTAALTAAWWAAEAGLRVVLTGQHLHGGAGADLEHPVHRHFLWGRQLAGYLGCASELLAELGELITGADMDGKVAG